MKSSKSNLFLFIALLFMLSTHACALVRYDVKGRVVDAETGKPIEGAAVTNLWYHYELMPRCLGLASGYKAIANYDTVTDADGYFTTTKHVLFYESDLGVYKEGYVGWSDDYIFNPAGNNIKRENFNLESGMLIKLEPFKKHYPRVEHAKFVVEDVDNTINGPTFNNAILQETLIYRRRNK